MKKLSIIVPIYNIEDYVEECIESILKQKFKDYELILVDDGSKDKSGEIIDKYKLEKNVIVIHKANGGLSDARNCGIKSATGEYLMFVDGDDFLLNDMCLENIGQAIEKSKADIIQYKMVYYYQQSNKYVYNKNIEDIKGNKIEKLNFLNKNGQVSISACDKIIKSSIIKDNKLYFEKGLSSEDVKWSYLLYFHINSIEVLSEDIYVYRQQRQNSITAKKSQKKAENLFYIIKYWIDYSYENEDIKTLYYNLISYWYLILRVDFKQSYYTDEMKNLCKKYDKMLMQYHDNYKVNKAYKLSKIIGFSLTIKIMRIYVLLKNKGIIKI